MTPVQLSSYASAALGDDDLWVLQDAAGRQFLIDQAASVLYTLPATEALTPVLEYGEWFVCWSMAERHTLATPPAGAIVGSGSFFEVRGPSGMTETLRTGPIRVVARVGLDVPDGLGVEVEVDLVPDLASRRQMVVVVETRLGERVLLDMWSEDEMCVVAYYRTSRGQVRATLPARPSYVWSNPRLGDRFRWTVENPSGRQREHRTLAEVVAIRVVTGV